MGLNVRAFTRTHIIPLGANDAEPVPGQGSSIFLVSADGPIRLEIDGEEPQTLRAGQGVELEPGATFDGFRIVDLSGSANEVELSIGYQARLVERRLSVANTVPVKGTKGYSSDTVMAFPGGGGNVVSLTEVALTANVATLIVGTSTSYGGYYLQADPANAGEVRLGSSAVNATSGIALSPGESVWIPARVGVYGYTTATGEVVRALAVIA